MYYLHNPEHFSLTGGEISTGNAEEIQKGREAYWEKGGKNAGASEGISSSNERRGEPVLTFFIRGKGERSNRGIQKKLRVQC